MLWYTYFRKIKFKRSDNLKKFVIQEVSLAEALKVHPKIKEWDRPEAGTVEYCSNRMGESKQLILGAYIDDEIIGYLIAYEKNESFYCWVTAVDDRYRRIGILTEMMRIYEEYAKELGYDKLTLKTLNNKREMLSYLANNHWNFINIIKNNDILLNEIEVEKKI